MKVSLQDLDDLRSFMTLSFEARRDLILMGATSFFPVTSLIDAILVNGNTHVELQAALDTASGDSGIYLRPNGRVVVIDHDIQISAPVNIPANVTLVSQKSAKLIGSGNGLIVLKTDSRVVGVRAKDLTYKLDEGGTKNILLLGCETEGGGKGPGDSQSFLRDPGTNPNERQQAYGVVALNRMINVQYGFLRRNTYRFNCKFNYFTNFRGSGRMFQNFGGIENIDEYNIGIGGIAGHLTLLDRNLSKGWCKNIIRHNHFEMISEEAISIDIMGNYSDKMGLIDVVTITGKIETWNDKPQLRFARASSANLIPSIHAGVVLTGPLAGKYLNIIYIDTYTAGQEYGLRLRDRTLTEAEFATFSNGSSTKVAIVVRADNNLYSNNTTINCRDSIKLWGSGWHNKIINNKSSQTYHFPHNVNDFAGAALAGLNSDTAIAAESHTCAIAPSNNLFANNNGIVGFNAVAYNAKDKVLTYIGAIPNTISGNYLINGQASWMRASSPAWTDSQMAFNIEEIDGVFNEVPTGANVKSFVESSDNWLPSTKGTTLLPLDKPFEIPHYLGAIPSNISLTPKNPSAGVFVACTANLDKIIVQFPSPLPEGFSAPEFDWKVEI